MALTAEHTLAHFTQWARIWRGWLAAEAGDGQESVAQLREALSAVRVTGAQFWSPLYTSLLADVHRRAGDADQALEVLGGALEYVQQTDERVYEAELHRLKAAVLLSRALSPTSQPRLASSRRWSPPGSRPRACGNCAWRPTSLACGRPRGGRGRRVLCSSLSTPGSPRDSIRRI